MSTQTLYYAVHDISSYINWIYFFHAWGFAPRYATIVHVHDCPGCRKGWLTSFSEEEQPKAAEAMQLYDDAQQLLLELDKKLGTRARFGIYDAVSDGDDIILFDTSFTVKERRLRLPLLRQQHVVHKGEPFLCLSDFIRPIESLERDRIGVFVTCADRRMEQLFTEGRQADDYRHLLAQTLADRLAEATAERMHEEVRRTYWGYAPEERLRVDELFGEKYQGIRPAVGYPSLPDQSLNFELDRWLDFGHIGIQLTENGCMNPHASVSGLMFAHPQARYFSVGKISDDQLLEYSRRKNMPMQRVRQFLAGNV